MLAEFIVEQPNEAERKRTDRAYLALGLGGVVVALVMLAMLAQFGSSWAGPSSEPYQRRRTPVVAPAIETEVTHQSDATLELRLALLRTRPCVCERTVDACMAITAFDRSAVPSCALLDNADLVNALTACSNDEAHEVLSRACPNLQ